MQTFENRTVVQHKYNKNLSILMFHTGGNVVGLTSYLCCCSICSKFAAFAAKKLADSSIALSVILCTMPYQTSYRYCFSSLTFWTYRTGRLVNVLLGDATDSVVHWVNVVDVWSGDMNCNITCSRNHTLTWAVSPVCVWALSWKTKNSSGN